MNRYAILPAAGRSRRMGQPKLRMPWGNYPTMLEATLATWEASDVTEVLVVVHPDDRELQQIVQHTTARLVIPQEAPPEMKISIREGLRWLAQHRTPAPDDVWLLAPADMPQFSPGIVATLVARHQGRIPPLSDSDSRSQSQSLSNSVFPFASPSPSIIVPRHAGRRGHPVLFPWSLAAEVERLEPTEGVNALLDRHPVLELNVEDPHILQDVDTPEDYRRFHPSGDQP